MTDSERRRGIENPSSGLYCFGIIFYKFKKDITNKYCNSTYILFPVLYYACLRISKDAKERGLNFRAKTVSDTWYFEVYLWVGQLIARREINRCDLRWIATDRDFVWNKEKYGTRYTRVTRHWFNTIWEFVFWKWEK